MSDSDEDWFNKDVDEMVQEVQKKTENVSIQSSGSFNPSESQESNLYRSMFSSNDDYGGTYEPRSNAQGAKNPSDKRSKQNAKDGDRYIHPMSGKKLQFISELKSLDTFLEVIQVDSGFTESFDKKLPPEQLRFLLAVLAKICQFPAREHVKDILGKLLNAEGILFQLKNFLVSATCSSSTMDEFLSICWAVEGLNLISKWLPKILEKLKKNFESKDRELSTKLADLLTVLGSDENKTQFKEIYPTLEELKGDNCDDIRPNVIKGKYPSVEDYLKTHLSLLREDFIEPLRDRIRDLQNHETPENVTSRDFYQCTKFLLNDTLNRHTAKGEMILVDLKASEREANHSGDLIDNLSINSKKLMYGTLLCFTSTLKFDDLILAVVSCKDNDLLSKGYIYVEIIKMYNMVDIFNRELIMFESEVYFEPYHHVYRVLRQLNDKNFPLADYIVDVKNNSEPPDYINDAQEYYYKHGNFTFNPLKPNAYPTAEGLNLDNSQYAAYQQSLGKKFCLIQGPPGTGKTFIGLEIVSTLLQNVNSSLLIICYTNHALDQFLSGILTYTSKIVRLGNQSKNEVLNEYNLKQVTDGAANSQNLRAVYYHTKKEYTKLMEKFDSLQQRPEKNEEVLREIFKVQKELRRISAKLDELKQIFDYNLIKNKKVIGMTTTYAARNNLLLQLLKIPIVIVEEAAEVLESHIVAALTSSTEHLILIGDHQQLRPTTSVYRLSEKFKMDISLFERMVNNNLNCVCLDTQHRMRPEIANLIRPVIYKNLKDADDVQFYENVRGVAKNLFFINHDIKEAKTSDETTKKNLHEAQFLLAFANYLLTHKKYKSSDIVILATYNGQMFQLLKDRKNYPLLERVRITVVDNYQGEESKIVLLSLVRNNKENRIGYLAMKNRICVALSRAQIGFYAIGAFDFLARNNSTWNEIKNVLEKQETIGDALPLQCTEHGNIVKVRSADDLKFSGSCICCD